MNDPGRPTLHLPPIHPDVVAVNLREIDNRLAQALPFVRALYHSDLDREYLDELGLRLEALREGVRHLGASNALNRDYD